MVLIIEEEVDDLGDDLRFLLDLQVLEVLVDPTQPEVCPEEVVVPDLPQLPQDLLLVIAHLVNILGGLLSGTLFQRRCAASSLETFLYIVLQSGWIYELIIPRHRIALGFISWGLILIWLVLLIQDILNLRDKPRLLALLIFEKSVARDTSDSDIRKLRSRLYSLIRIGLLLVYNTTKDREVNLFGIYSNCLE